MLQRTIDRLLAEQAAAVTGAGAPPAAPAAPAPSALPTYIPDGYVDPRAATTGLGPSVGKGKGRSTMPMMERTLGVNVHTVPHVGFSRASKYLDNMPVHYNRQVAYDEDIDGEHIEPSAARKAHIATRDLEGTAFYEDPRAELDFRNMKLDPRENAEVIKVMKSALMKDNMDKRQAGLASKAILERARRREQALGVTDEAKAEFIASRTTIAHKLVDMARPTREEAARDMFLPPAQMGETARLETKAPSVLEIADMKAMLDRDPFPGMSKEGARQFRGLNDISSIRRVLEPEILVTEKHREHYNCNEVVETLLKAGCKLAAWSRIQSPARLAEVLDPEFYASNLVYDSDLQRTLFTGGHEHYEAYSGTTSLIALHFGCCRKAMKKEEDKTKATLAKIATSTLDSVAAADKGALAEFIDPDSDYWDDTDFDQDDDYTGGNDLQDVLTQFDHMVSVYLVEACDRSYANEILTKGLLPPSVEKNKKIDHLDDDDAIQEDKPVDPDEDMLADVIAKQTLEKENAKAIEDETENAQHLSVLKLAVADGIGTQMNFEEARRLVGRYKAAQYVHFLTHPRPMFPLCLRAYKFTHASAR
jgi:hypothetical protein